MYELKRYSIDNARELQVKIKSSTRKHKKIDIYTQTGLYICSIGDCRYSDYPSYIISHGLEYANKRRLLYKQRHERYRHVISSPSYYADRLLW
jgi:hypothetical protein